MARLPELPARRVLRALRRAGFREVRRRGSHRFLAHADGRTLLFAVHEAERVGPKLLAKILKDARIPRIGHSRHPRYVALRYSWCRPPRTGFATTPAAVGGHG